MRIAIASDHRGVAAKTRLVSLLKHNGNDVTDFGADGVGSVDYPDFAFKVAGMVGTGAADRGVLLCGTGIGMCIAANKVTGVRAAPCHDLITAEISRRHNDSNIICMSADMLSPDLIEQMVRIWMETGFEGGRHARRIEKIILFEQNAKG